MTERYPFSYQRLAERAYEINLPLRLIQLGFLLGCAALLTVYLSPLELATHEALEPVSGEIQSLKIYRTRYDRYLNIDVLDGTKIRHLRQVDMSKVVTTLCDLKQGDSIDALVKPDSATQDLVWFWEIYRGQDQILSYVQTLEYFEKRLHRTRIGGTALAIVSTSLVLGGLVYRRKRASWMKNHQEN